LVQKGPIPELNPNLVSAEGTLSNMFSFNQITDKHNSFLDMLKHHGGAMSRGRNRIISLAGSGSRIKTFNF
jgi:hypothetical protein